MMDKKAITWMHFAYDCHEVVPANGCWSESLPLGPMVMQALSETQRNTLDGLFRKDFNEPVFTGMSPANSLSALNGPPARRCLKVGEARKIIALHSKAEGCRGAKEIRKWDDNLAMEQHEVERVREARSVSRNPPPRVVN